MVKNDEIYYFIFRPSSSSSSIDLPRSTSIVCQAECPARRDCVRCSRWIHRDSMASRPWGICDRRKGIACQIHVVPSDTSLGGRSFCSSSFALLLRWVTVEILSLLLQHTSSSCSRLKNEWANKNKCNGNFKKKKRERKKICPSDDVKRSKKGHPTTSSHDKCLIKKKENTNLRAGKFLSLFSRRTIFKALCDKLKNLVSDKLHTTTLITFWYFRSVSFRLRFPLAVVVVANLRQKKRCFLETHKQLNDDPNQTKVHTILLSFSSIFATHSSFTLSSTTKRLRLINKTTNIESKPGKIQNYYSNREIEKKYFIYKRDYSLLLQTFCGSRDTITALARAFLVGQTSGIIRYDSHRQRQEQQVKEIKYSRQTWLSIVMSSSAFASFVLIQFSAVSPVSSCFVLTATFRVYVIRLKGNANFGLKPVLVTRNDNNIPQSIPFIQSHDSGLRLVWVIERNL